jgi:hypothetical protein
MRANLQHYWVAKSLGLWRFETVADPGVSANELGISRVKFDLLSKLRDKDSKIVGLTAAVWSPDCLEEFAVFK